MIKPITGSGLNSSSPEAKNPGIFHSSATFQNLAAMQETWVQFLGWEDPLEKEMTTFSSILAWRIPMDRGTWQATVHGVARVGHNLVTKPPPPLCRKHLLSYSFVPKYQDILIKLCLLRQGKRQKDFLNKYW